MKFLDFFLPAPDVEVMEALLSETPPFALVVARKTHLRFRRSLASAQDDDLPPVFRTVHDTTSGPLNCSALVRVTPSPWLWESPIKGDVKIQVSSNAGSSRWCVTSSPSPDCESFGCFRLWFAADDSPFACS